VWGFGFGDGRFVYQKVAEFHSRRTERSPAAASQLIAYLARGSGFGVWELGVDVRNRLVSIRASQTFFVYHKVATFLLTADRALSCCRITQLIAYLANAREAQLFTHVASSQEAPTVGACVRGGSDLLARGSGFASEEGTT